MSMIEQYGMYQNNTKDIWKDKKTRGTNERSDIDKTKGTSGRNAVGKKKEEVSLSDKAKTLLEELQKKYQNMDFIVADYSSEEEASHYLSHGVKEYSVLIDPATLEEMANEEETKQKYMGIIDDATGHLSQMMEQLGEEGDEVTRVGVIIAKDGTVSYFAELEKMSEKQRERIQAAREEKKEEQKTEDKKQKEEWKEEREDRDLGSRVQNRRADREWHLPEAAKHTTVKANSIDELMEKIRSVDWEQINAKEFRQTGARLDLSI